MNILSIITITYNNPEDLEKTLQSVSEQKSKSAEFELIIIDGSSKEHINDFVYKRYTNIISKAICEPDNGIYDAMNKGLKNATGDAVLFLNSGDEFDSDFNLCKFQRKYDLSEKVYYTCVKMETKKYVFIRPDFEKKRQFTYSDFGHQGVFVPKKIYKKYSYDLTKQYSADYFWMKSIWEENENIFLDIISTKFQLGGVSNDYSFKVLKKYCKQSVPVSYKLLHVIKFILHVFLGTELLNKFLFGKKYKCIKR